MCSRRRTPLSRVSRLYHNPFIIGMMVGLIVNLGLMPMLQSTPAFAEPISISGNSNNGSGRLVSTAPTKVDRPDINEGPVIDEAYILNVQQQVFQNLFGTPWQEEHWTYPIDQAPETGGVYTGENYLGQPYVLEVAFAVEVDLLGLPELTNDQVAYVLDHELRAWGAIVAVSTDLATAHLHGTIVSYLNDAGDTVIELMPTNLVSPNSPAFWSDPQEAELHVSTMTVEIVQVDVEPGTGNGDCDRCTDKFNRDVERAERDYQNAVNLANTNRAICINGCNAAFNIAKNAADNTLAICLGAATALKMAATIGCAFTIFGALACVLGVQAAYAIAVAACIAYHAVQMNAANAGRTACIAGCNAAHAAAVAAAEQNRQNKLDDAAEDLADCLNNCDGGTPNIGSTEIDVVVVDVVPM